MQSKLKRFDLARVRPSRDTSRIWRGNTVLETEMNGWVEDEKHGLYICETRMLSRRRCLINGQALDAIAYSAVSLHSSLGYYVVAPPGVHAESDKGSGHIENESQLTLEVKLARFVGEGLHEDLRITNFTQSRTDPFELEIEVDADFADVVEHRGDRKQRGQVAKQWSCHEPEGGELSITYSASHSYSHQGSTGDAHIKRVLFLNVLSEGLAPSHTTERLHGL